VLASKLKRVIGFIVLLVAAFLVNGLILRWLGGFGSAGQAMERWGDRSARRWARKHGLKGF
jgi:uncharacterized protein HemY